MSLPSVGMHVDEPAAGMKRNRPAFHHLLLSSDGPPLGHHQSQHNNDLALETAYFETGLAAHDSPSARFSRTRSARAPESGLAAHSSAAESSPPFQPRSQSGRAMAWRESSAGQHPTSESEGFNPENENDNLDWNDEESLERVSEVSEVPASGQSSARKTLLVTIELVLYVAGEEEDSVPVEMVKGKKGRQIASSNKQKKSKTKKLKPFTIEKADNVTIEILPHEYLNLWEFKDRVFQAIAQHASDYLILLHDADRRNESEDESIKNLGLKIIPYCTYCPAYPPKPNPGSNPPEIDSTFSYQDWVRECRNSRKNATFGVRLITRDPHEELAKKIEVCNPIMNSGC